MKSSKRISKKEAKVLEQEFVTTRTPILNESLKRKKLITDEDVREVWFDLEDIKEYIAYVEAAAAKKGINNGLGLRVYLGAYPNEKQYHNPGKTTVFFMPTKKGNSLLKSGEEENENIEDVDGLNLGYGRIPPYGI